MCARVQHELSMLKCGPKSYLSHGVSWNASTAAIPHDHLILWNRPIQLWMLLLLSSAHFPFACFLTRQSGL